ncbi:MAG TPA: homoserine O-succinyltransferase, partial [Prolixibacteraceae bacterium]|nr:homoserine O-succinyltransferase [Prolixibacteraceae bacterium]
FIPHSRHTEIRAEDVGAVPQLEVIAQSDEAGVAIVQERSGRKLFVTGHAEYAALNLHAEYVRDVAKGLTIEAPKHYYRNNDPLQNPVVRWRGHANLLFSNWLNYFVYQETPYNIEEIM